MGLAKRYVLILCEAAWSEVLCRRAVEQPHKILRADLHRGLYICTRFINNDITLFKPGISK